MPTFWQSDLLLTAGGCYSRATCIDLPAQINVHYFGKELKSNSDMVKYV